MKGIEHKSFSFEQKSGDTDAAGGATIEGIVACFLNIDCQGDMFVPGCFTDHLPFFKSEGVIRDEHWTTTGRIDDAAEVAGGLWFKGVILPTSQGRDQAILVKNKAIKRLSIGSRNYGHWSDDPEEVQAIWAKHGYEPSTDDLIKIGYGVRIIDRAKPYEASTTWFPANDKTSITSVKSEDGSPVKPTFDQHSLAALATVEEFLGRAEKLATLRGEKGRGLSAKSRTRIAQLQDRMTKLVSIPEPKSAEPPVDANVVYAEYLATCARLNGCQV